jgi:hypothetical protein
MYGYLLTPKARNLLSQCIFVFSVVITISYYIPNSIHRLVPLMQEYCVLCQVRNTSLYKYVT